jgi:hypothetical protein
MTFGELLEGIGKNLGVELADEGGAAAVEVDGNPIVLHMADDDLLLIHADLGEMAPENRDRIRAVALEANFLYQGTGGATLAVDPNSGRLHLQKYNWLDRLDAENAVESLARFADTVKTWKGLLAETMARAPEESDALSAQMPGGFMAV